MFDRNAYCRRLRAKRRKAKLCTECGVKLDTIYTKCRKCLDKCIIRTQKPNRRFSLNKHEAIKLGKTWELTEDQYYLLIKQPCFYCGLALNSSVRSGLDRVDNTLGYIIDNVVPCCVECNVAKSDLFSYNEMKQFIGPAIRAVKLARM